VLPDIPTGTCGNGVIDGNEDCDTFPAANAPSSVCRSQGSVDECRLDCSRLTSGERNPCPKDWGCSRDAICRPLSGNFEQRADAALGNAGPLMSADFDGDGRDDLVSLEPADSLGRSRLRFHYFDERGALAESTEFPRLLFSPVIADLSGDGRSDVAFSDGRIGLLLSDARSWVPKTFGSYWLPNSRVRMLAAYNERIGEASAVVALAKINDQPNGFYVPNGPDALRLAGELPGPLPQIIGDPVSGNVIESTTRSPCDEAVLALRGANEFQLVDFCTRDSTSEVVWRAQVETRIVPLSPPAAIDASPQLVDIDGDGHLDVLLGADGRPYVAYGDGQGLASATPYRLELANPDKTDPEIPMPLAAGDFTGDGWADFVFPDHLLVSLPPAASGSLPRYVLERANEGGAWTEAKIADLNGNGKLDVVAASSARPNIDFFNGTGTEHPTAFNLTTSGPVRELTVGDFDGDLLSDLAFAEASASSSRPDALMVAFGNLAGSPSAPRAIARVSAVEQLSVFEEDGIGNLMVSSSETRGQEETGVLTFLEGSGDRSPLAPYALTLFQADGTLRQSMALSITAGAFSAPGKRDVLALASPNLKEKIWELWLLPELYSGSSVPTRMQAKFRDDLVPAHAGPGDYAVHVNLASVSADLDGEGRDEAVFAMPNDSQGCGLVFAGTEDNDRVELLTLMLEAPCERPQLAAKDVDGDGALDVVLLTGSPGGLDAKLLVFWNDGHGAFLSERVTRVSDLGDSPVQFTTLAATPARPFSFAYVTESALRLVTASSDPRRFEPPATLAPLEHGTGVVAADVNGDGATDLALTDSGTLGILKAELEATR
jgi:hypothetical protein